MSKRIETIANLSIIVVAVVAAATLIERHFFSNTASAGKLAQPAAVKPVVGTKLTLSGVDWSKSKQTLVLALSKSCHFCTESAPFYQKLSQEEAKSDRVRLVAVFPRETQEEGRQYLDELGISVAQVATVSLQSIGARGTPTLILVDGSGRVQDSWTGRLAQDKEEEVLSKLRCEECK